MKWAIFLAAVYMMGSGESKPTEQLPVPLPSYDIFRGRELGSGGMGPVAFKGVGSAPLDINNEVGGTLDLISGLVGALGSGASGLVMGLTGISITDCGGSLKNEDLTTISCADFLATISECDSLTNIKPLLQQAQKKYKKNPKKKAAPCFKNSSKKKA